MNKQIFINACRQVADAIESGELKPGRHQLKDGNGNPKCSAGVNPSEAEKLFVNFKCAGTAKIVHPNDRGDFERVVSNLRKIASRVEYGKSLIFPD